LPPGIKAMEILAKTKPFLARFWQWVKDQIVQEVPDDIAVCEYDCRKPQCVMGEWETCDRRLLKAAGEVMPRSAESAEKTE
jgi:curli biogenesis system outer membrane secretion channel CsgG